MGSTLSQDALERKDSADSLSTWSPFGRVKAVCAPSEERSRPAPVDRRKLAMTSRKLDDDGRGNIIECTRQVRLSSNSVRAVNARQALEIAELKNELKKTRRCQKQRSPYEKQINTEYSILNNEFMALKEDIYRILYCGIGDRKIHVRLLESLDKFRQFFNEKVSQINSVDSTWPTQYKVHLLEHLKKMFAQNVSDVDKLINTIIETK